MTIARFTPAQPLPGRSYWAIYENDEPKVMFSLGDGNVLTDQLLSFEQLQVLLTWLADMLPIVEWPQLFIGVTLSADTVQRLITPPLLLMNGHGHGHTRPKRRKPKPSLARFLQKSP